MSEPDISWAEHLCTVVLPWWEQAVRTGGGVFTCYSNTGERVSDDLYTWSQGRWAWLAAELSEDASAGRLPLDAEQWSRRAVETAEVISRHAVLGDGTVAFRLSRDGDPLPSGPGGQLATSVFADLFAALGLAAGIRMLETGDPRRETWSAQAHELLEHAERSTVDGTALSEPYPVPDGFSDLAAPMSLVHTASELLRAVPHSDAARAVRDRSWSRLLGDGGFLQDTWWWEFRPESDRDHDTLLARHRTPGHLLELCWMLVHSADEAEARGDIGDIRPPDIAHLARLATRAFEIGEDAELGGLFRYVDAAGGEPRGAQGSSRYESLVAETWDTKLWWVHVEAMYAAALLSTRLGDPDLAASGRRIAEYTMRVFPDPAQAEWLQIRNRDGSPLDAVVALPVKDPFHIIRALILLNRLTASTPQGVLR